MAEQTRELRLSHAEMSGVFSALLALPRAPRALHPSQERSRYCELREWVERAMAGVVRAGRAGRAVCEQEQRVMVALLQEMAELGRRECAEKGALLELVREYLVGTLNAYWAALENANREVWYEFEHNSVRVEREYISELKRLQADNDELRKDKDHRWRNMFMLIKDNRIHRRQNRKLLTSITYEMEKNVALAEQMILLREENEKLKLKLAAFEDDPVRVESFAETELKLMELKESIRSYPKRSKKILRNDLVKIEIQQINNLNDKIKFIIKAIEETGEIIDEFYDEETIWTNFQYNISTQTEPNAQQEKATNTPALRAAHAEAAVAPGDLARFEVCETHNLIIRGLKKGRKETRERESRLPAFASTFSGGRLASRREEGERAREPSSRQRLPGSQFSICESVKMTIHNGRISYISTYNTEIFNGPDILRRIEQKLETEAKIARAPEQLDRADAEAQTEPEEAPPRPSRSQAKQRTKFSSALPLLSVPLQNERQNERDMLRAVPQLRISEEVSVEVNVGKSRSQHLKVKFIPFPSSEKEASLAKPNFSDKSLDSSRREARSKKRLNTLEHDYSQPEKEKPIERSEFCTQTEETKGKELGSICNLQSKDEPLTNPSSNSINSSFLQDLKQTRKNFKSKAFNQSADSLVPAKPKSKPGRRSEMSPLKQAEPKKLQKLSRTELNHKRASTETSEALLLSQTAPKPSRQFRMKPLHRISEVLTEGDLTREDVLNPAREKGLPLAVTREGEIRACDFAKGVEKILKSMDVRRNEILSNSHSLRTYLSSYFKCLYGREIYPSFLHFLATADPQESVLCFARLANPKAPEPYLADIFKGFVRAVGKCYVLGESPCSPRVRQEVLKYLAGLFLEEEGVTGFALRMRNRGCYTLMGWFNCLEQELRAEAIHSELYALLSLWLGDPVDALPYEFIEELAYFMQTDPLTAPFLVRCKVLLREGAPLHRFCLFSHRFQRGRMLQLRGSIEEEYQRRVGVFHYEEAVRRIEQHRTILCEFRHLERCYRQWSAMWERYGSRADRHLLMLLELTVQEYRLKNEMPLSRELKYLSLVFEGLQKKKEFEALRLHLDTGQGRENIITSKSAL